MILNYSKWLSVKLSTRVEIARLFGIPKLRSTHVSNNVVLDDGYNIQQIEETLTIPTLQDYLKSDEEDIQVLFQMLVDKVEGRETSVSVPETRIEEETEEVKPKRGRKPKVK